MTRPRATRSHSGARAAAIALAVLVTMGASDCQPPEEKAPEPRAGSSGQVSVPLKVITGGGGTVVLVPIWVNGRGPYDFVLDTGASSSVVSESLSQRLRLRDTGEDVHITGVAGEKDVPVVALRRWSLGGQRLRGRELPAIDLDSDLAAGPVYGLLGSDELRRFGAVRIDYKKRRLILRDRTAKRSPRT